MIQSLLYLLEPAFYSQDLLDYEYDSDDDWEEPVEGEDIANSDGVSNKILL